MHPLIPDTSYHIFNYTYEFENIFRKEEDFCFFPKKYWLQFSGFTRG